VTNRIALPKPSCSVIILSLIFLFQDVHAQNTLDKAGLGAATPAAAAYSTRRLSSSYSGYALRVLRTSDNALSDIGFTAGGDLDTAALKTFVGSSTGQVAIWYDQSGHGLDLSQATIARQPILVNSGTINREDNQPFIRFFGSGASYNSLNLAADMTTVGHVTAVMRLSASGDGFILSHTGVYYWHSNPPNYLFNGTWASSSIQGGNVWSNGASYTPLNTPWPSTLTVAEVEPSAPSTETTWNNIGSDRNQYHDISLGGGYGELILFASALPTTDRQALESNEGAFFSVTILPVTWLSFTARAGDDAVALQWQTAFEQNSKAFTIQYSPDGYAWASVATVPAAGNSSSTRTYNYVRPNPPAGDNYYRILETDLDGNAHYSAVNLVKIGARQDEFKLLQNPVTTGVLRVSINAPTTLSLFTVDGKLLWKRHYEPGAVDIRIGNHARGEYILAGKTTRVRLLAQ
jgi:hypothetical protein